MNHYQQGLICCLLATTVMSCQHLTPVNDTSTESIAEPGKEELSTLPSRSRLLELVDFVEWLYSQPARNLHGLYDRMEINDESAPFDKVLFAMLLSVPDTPFRDDKRALRLLNNVVMNSGSQDKLKLFARLQVVHLTSRQMLIRQWHKALEEERQRRISLEKKLEELKAVEKMFNQRNEDR